MDIACESKRVSFTSDISKFSNKVDAQIADIIELVSIELYNRLIKKTPVDTGRARANWNISVGQPDLSITKNVTKTPVIFLPGIQEGEDNVVWITNNLEYVYYLDKGSSTQAPRGMVDVSLVEIKAWVKGQLT